MRDDSGIEWNEAFGLRFSNLAFEEAVEGILEMASSRSSPFFRSRFAVTPNVDHIVQIQRDEEMRAIYRAADLVLCDGAPLKWAMRWLGRPLKAKVSGSDLLAPLCGGCAARGLRPFFLGAAPGVGEECARRLRRQYPNLDVAGIVSPPLIFEDDPQTLAAAIEAVRAAKPDLLLVALGTPRQEKFIYRNLDPLGVPMSIGVGAAFDFVAGVARRAPAWMRRCGGEWLWRLAHEPRRLGRRYLIDDVRFFAIVWREWRTRRGDKN